MNDDNLIEKIKNNLKHTPNNRMGDINILLLAERVYNLENIIKDSINEKIDSILKKINMLPCEVNTYMINENKKGYTENVNALKEHINCTDKKSQWRIGLIVGIICAIPSIFIAVIKFIEFLNKVPIWK